MYLFHETEMIISMKSFKLHADGCNQLVFSRLNKPSSNRKVISFYFLPTK